LINQNGVNITAASSVLERPNFKPSSSQQQRVKGSNTSYGFTWKYKFSDQQEALRHLVDSQFIVIGYIPDQP
jgi:hypothetical protein